MDVGKKLLHDFDQGNKDGVLSGIHEIAEGGHSFPLKEALVILDETDDIEIVAGLLELMLLKLDDVADWLMNGLFEQASAVVKRHIILVMALSGRSVYMQFLLGQYVENPYNRSAIRQIAFKNKPFLFMNLARYVESIELTPETIEVCCQILRTIPRDVILSKAGLFMGTKVLDLYYSMPESSPS